MSAAAELSSMTTALDELARRLAVIAEDFGAAKRDDLASELYEVERALAGATRRLTRVAASARRA